MYGEANDLLPCAMKWPHERGKEPGGPAWEVGLKKNKK
ncbi:hypothetical protein AtDm6_1975 [Acetobacter tropicalis]|uniref:Uncharacterized protein n=1 Tax=Acetobacter tropicalis TaxID=104102 RepID=A0A094YL63_9PROT|nr:hypothetical protein AtDm6_1975 [Acetobacter tropicalis]